MIKTKAIHFLKKKVGIYLLASVVIFSIIAVLLGHYNWVSSAILGSIFGFLGFSHLINTQEQILSKKQKKIVLPSFFVRLGIYALPIALGSYLKSYFIIAIILVFLVLSQALYIGLEIITNLKRSKR